MFININQNKRILISLGLVLGQWTSLWTMETSFQNEINKNFLVACRNGNIASVKHNLNVEADLECRDIHGDTGLIMAAEQGRSRVVLFLLEHKANINSKNLNGSTALLAALRVFSSMNICTILEILQRNPDLTVVSKNGETIINRAFESNREEIVQAVLNKNMDVTQVIQCRYASCCGKGFSEHNIYSFIDHRKLREGLKKVIDDHRLKKRPEETRAISEKVYEFTKLNKDLSKIVGEYACDPLQGVRPLTPIIRDDERKAEMEGEESE